MNPAPPVTNIRTSNPRTQRPDPNRAMQILASGGSAAIRPLPVTCNCDGKPL